LNNDYIHKRKVKLKPPSTIDKQQRYEEENDHIHKNKTKLKTFQTNIFMNKQKDFELNEDYIHKRKIKLKSKQLDAILGETKSITIKIQEQIILRQNLERWLKEKDRQNQIKEKLEAKLISLNQIKQKLINIGKTRNKRKKKFTDSLINTKETKQLLEQNRKDIRNEKLEHKIVEQELTKQLEEVNEIFETPYLKNQLTEEVNKICKLIKTQNKFTIEYRSDTKMTDEDLLL
jgi:hypothetical protein